MDPHYTNLLSWDRQGCINLRILTIIVRKIHHLFLIISSFLILKFLFCRSKDCRDQNDFKNQDLLRTVCNLPKYHYFHYFKSIIVHLIVQQPIYLYNFIAWRISYFFNLVIVLKNLLSSKLVESVLSTLYKSDIDNRLRDWNYCNMTSRCT